MKERQPGEEHIAALLAAGRHAEAAAAARGAGRPAEAAAIYEKIWDFRAAADCAREAGDDLAALRHLADARALDEATALAADLAARGPDSARAAADVLAARRLFDQAATLREQIGDAEPAAALYRRAGRPLDAARLIDSLGRPRDAGRLLEKLLASAPDPDLAARASLALGSLLARLGEHQAAARRLQDAARHPSTRAAALAALVPELAALGLRDAAGEALAAARALDDRLPLTVEDLVVRRAAGAPGALAGGRYRLLRLLGAGAAGRVYQARDEISGAEVAIKMFPVADTQHDAWRRFLREARLWASTHHPHIVQVLDFREDLGFYVMELLAGTLAERLGSPLSAGQARRLGLELAAALVHAHARGIVHRDVKPANVLLSASGTAKLGDFGVAHLLELGPTQTGALIGTLAYMSPEQITGAPLTAAADLYALGVTLFQALTGRLPFLGPDFIAQHLCEAPPRPSHIDPRVGAGWDELIARLLAKDPAARPASAQAVAEEIARLDAGARPVLSLPRVGSAPAPPPSAPPPRPPAAIRLQAEVPIGATTVSSLARALDGALDRTVVLERFADGHPDPATLARLLAIAGAQSPHLQRVLGWEPAERLMTFEAPAGAPLDLELLTPRGRAAILRQLAGALAALHESGTAHGAVARERILVDDDGFAVLLAAGLGPAGAATLPDDVAALARLFDAPILDTAEKLSDFSELEEGRLDGR